MDALWFALGALVVAAGLVDIFLTVLHYEDPGLIAVPAYRLLWEALRRVTEALPAGVAWRARSWLAPFMVVLNLVLWVGAQVLGFALLYYPGISGGDYVTGGVGTSFVTALYVSGATFTSLSFSDVEPRSLGYHVLAAFQTMLGLAILTLVISYLLNLYRVLHEQGVLATRMFHRSDASNEPRRMLEPHFVDGRVEGLDVVVRDLHTSLVSFHEGVRRYPVVWYFHTRRPYRSLPYIFWVAASVAATLRWAAPAGHPSSQVPSLPGLVTGFDEVLGEVETNFLPRPLPDPPAPATPEEFRRAAAGGDGAERAAEGLLGRFLEIEADMHRLAGVRQGPVEDRYPRYVDWARFTARARSFVELAARDLGIDPELMYRDPRRIQR
jgi:hypothetical protein